MIRHLPSTRQQLGRAVTGRGLDVRAQCCPLDFARGVDRTDVAERRAVPASEEAQGAVQMNRAFDIELAAGEQHRRAQAGVESRCRDGQRDCAVRVETGDQRDRFATRRARDADGTAHPYWTAPPF